jgi:hypothetical protein
MSNDHIAGLLHEMERHVLAGREDRVADIKRELADFGWHEDSGDTAEVPAEESAPLERAVAPDTGGFETAVAPQE